MIYHDDFKGKGAEFLAKNTSCCRFIKSLNRSVYPPPMSFPKITVYTQLADPSVITWFLQA